MSTPKRTGFLVLLGHAFLLQITMLFLRLAMTYEAVSIGLDVLWVGVIGGAFGIAPAALALYTGSYIDRLGERVALTVSAAMSLTASVAFVFMSPSLTALLMLSVFAGLAQFVGVAAQHSAAGKIEGTGRGGSIGHVTMIISLAHMVGPLAFGVIASSEASMSNTDSVYRASLLVGLLLAFGSLFLRGLPKTPVKSGTGVWRTASTIVRTRGYMTASIASLVLFSAMDLLVIYLPLFGSERGLDPATVGVLLAIRGGASVVCRLFYGRLFGAIGRGRLLDAALFMSGIAIALIPVAPTVVVMGALIFVAGFGLGIGAPLTLGWMAEIIPPATLGSALALRLAINRIGQVTLPAVVGLVASGLGSSAVVVAIGASLLCSGGFSVVAGRCR